MIADLAKIAGIIGLLGYIPYVLAIVRRKSVPNQATWWIWSVVGWAAFASYFAAGGNETSWLMLSYAVGPLIVALLSLKYGKNCLDKFDMYCLAASLFSLALWAITDSPATALLINLIIDMLGSLPTVRKTFLEPDSEDTLSWLVFWVGNTLNFFANLFQDTLTFSGLAYPSYLFLLASVMVILCSRVETKGLITSVTKNFFN